MGALVGADTGIPVGVFADVDDDDVMKDLK
jgi:hypothetical protein